MFYRYTRAPRDREKNKGGGGVGRASLLDPYARIPSDRQTAVARPLSPPPPLFYAAAATLAARECIDHALLRRASPPLLDLSGAVGVTVQAGHTRWNCRDLHNGECDGNDDVGVRWGEKGVSDIVAESCEGVWANDGLVFDWPWSRELIEKVYGSC